MAVGRSAAAKLDLNKTITTLGLKGSTASALTAFKKRNDDARRRVNVLSAQPQTIDFAHFRKTLNNTAVVDEIEREFKNFKPSTYDVSKQLRAIEQFEAQAVKQAEETKVGVEKELKSLEETLRNIETARPFEELTVDDVVKARPDIDDKVTSLVSKGRWNVPGYKEKFGDLSVL